MCWGSCYAAATLIMAFLQEWEVKVAINVISGSSQVIPPSRLSVLLILGRFTCARGHNTLSIIRLCSWHITYLLLSWRSRLKFGDLQQKSYLRFLEWNQEYLVHYIYGIGVVDIFLLFWILNLQISMSVRNIVSSCWKHSLLESLWLNVAVLSYFMSVNLKLFFCKQCLLTGRFL